MATKPRMLSFSGDGDNRVDPDLPQFNFIVTLDRALERGERLVFEHAGVTWTVPGGRADGQYAARDSAGVRFNWAVRDGGRSVYVVVDGDPLETGGELTARLTQGTTTVQTESVELTLLRPEDKYIVPLGEQTDMPNVAVVDASGARGNLFDGANGDLVLLDWSAAWCVPSAEIAARHAELAARLGGDFMVRTLLLQDYATAYADGADAAAWAERFGLPSSAVVALDGTEIDKYAFAKNAGVPGFPTLSVIDPATGLVLFSFDTFEARGFLGDYESDEVTVIAAFAREVVELFAADNGDTPGIELTSGAEADTLAGSFLADRLDGGEGGNTINAGYGNDVVLAGNGNNQLFGGQGDDRITAGNGANFVEAGAGDDVVELGDGRGNVVLGGDGGDAITVGAGGSGLYGGAGGDLITSGDGGDFIDGGEGDDVIRSGGGNDQVRGDFGDDLIEAGDGNDNVGGGDGDDVVDAGAGDDQVFFNGNGVDTVDGGAGFDTLRFDGLEGTLRVVWSEDGFQTVTADGETRGSYRGFERIFAPLAASEQVGHSGANDLYGGFFDDVLDGGGAAAGAEDLLDGFNGNDVLILRAGAVRALGGSDDDRYVVLGAATGVIEDDEYGFDTLDLSGLGGGAEVSLAGAAGVLRSPGGAALRLVGIDAVVGTGFADTIRGSDGANLIDGGAGADRMVGGMGDDVYVVDDAGDRAGEKPTGGLDAVRSSISYRLGAYIENLELTGTAAISGTGNELANQIVGNAAENRLAGGAGDDVLVGLGGRDVLTGGSGADAFVFLPGDTAADAKGADRIADFSRADGDRIALHLFDLDPATEAREGFRFIETAAFGGTAGELRYLVSGANTLVQGDMDGDGVADLVIRLTGRVDLVAGDFLL